MEQVQVYVVGTVRSRHTFFVVFPELGSPPAWTQESLEALNARDIEYDGRLYTRYEISQIQRARERAVRKWKRRYLAEDAAGADTTASAVRLRQARQSLADFTRATGGRVDSARTSVHGFGWSEGSRAAWDVRHNTLTNAAGQTIIKVSKSDIKGPRNGITQKTNAKGSKGGYKTYKRIAVWIKQRCKYQSCCRAKNKEVIPFH